MMYSAATVALFASMMPLASAHYFFDKLVLPNGQASAEFVRSNTRQTAYMPTKWKNTFDNTTPDSVDFRCNVGATNKAAKGTAKVKAGDALAMTLGVGATMKHPGPAQVYMSKASTTAASYDGSGDWFKIHQETVCRPNNDIKQDAWCTWDKDRVSFKIPTNIPDGDYLVRAEHIGLHGAHDGQAEFYYGCAQITVSGGTGSLPTSGMVKIPGVYKKDDPEVNFSVWGGNKAYPAKGPGPAVFGESGSSSGSETSPAPAASSAPASNTPSNNSGNSGNSGNNSGNNGSGNTSDDYPEDSTPASPAPAAPSASSKPSPSSAPVAPKPSASSAPGAPGAPKPSPIASPAPAIPSKGASQPQASNIPSAAQPIGQQPGASAPKPSCGSHARRRHARDLKN